MFNQTLSTFTYSTNKFPDGVSFPNTEKKTFPRGIFILCASKTPFVNQCPLVTSSYLATKLFVMSCNRTTLAFFINGYSDNVDHEFKGNLTPIQRCPCRLKRKLSSLTCIKCSYLVHKTNLINGNTSACCAQYHRFNLPMRQSTHTPPATIRDSALRKFFHKLITF